MTTALTTTQGLIVHLAVDATTLYWANTATGEVIAMPKSGGPPTVLTKGLTDPGPLTINDGSIYVSGAAVSESGAVIFKLPSTGGPATKLVSTSGDVEELVADDQRVYWASGVRAFGATTSTGEITHYSGYGNVTSVAVDPERLFWLDPAAQTISSTLTSKGPIDVLPIESAKASGLAVDATDLYFGAPSIARMSRTGGASTFLAAETAPAHAIVLDDSCVYWTAASSLRTAPKEGGPAVTIAGESVGSPVVVDETGVYWVDTASSSIMKLVK